MRSIQNFRKFLLKTLLLCIFLFMGAEASLAASDFCEKPEAFQSPGDLEKECEIKSLFLKLKAESEKYGLKLSEITLFQGPRFVSRAFYDSAKRRRIPIRRLYQARSKDRGLPVEQRKTDVWDNWALGVLQLQPFVGQLNLSQPDISLEDFQELHRGFYQNSLDEGDFSHPPRPGELKSPYDSDAPWWTISSETERRTAKSAISQIQAEYRQLGLTPSPLRGLSGKALEVVRLDGSEIYGADSRLLDVHLNNLLKFLNRQLKAINDSSLQKPSKYTPFQLALFIQQYFVRIHPFHDGNGRMSRLIQEVVSTSFGLPPGASGDLMSNDVLETSGQYYEQGLSATLRQMRQLEDCLTIEYPRLIEKTSSKEQGSLKRISPRNFSYDCRLIQ